MNIIKFTKTEITELDMIVKRVLRQRNMHGRQSRDERLYLSRRMGGRGLKSYQTAYEGTKIRIVCYICKSDDAAIANLWERDLNKEFYSLSKEMVKIFGEIGHDLSFEFGDILLDGEVVEGDFAGEYKKLKRTYKTGKVFKIKKVADF